jgi:uncharacterized membrane protein (DUF4010 family)
MGTLFSGIAMGFVVMMAVAMNWRQMMWQKQLALTTSTALTIVGFAGILCGQGHIFTPVVVGVVTAALLAWKQPISGFVSGLSDSLSRDHAGDGGHGSTQRPDRPCSGFASGYGMRHSADPHAVNQRCAVATLPRASKCWGIPPLSLESPFKLSAALKFGLVFLVLNVVGGLAQRNFGPASFYFVSMAGGLLSSASSIASAATLITHHEISATTGVNGIILSSLTSILINVPLIRSMTKEAALRRKACLGLALVAVVGLVGVGVNEVIFAFAPRLLAGS